MADYYPLIARAVAGLDKNTGENRRALYERARTALVNQLRSVDPALNESDITRERLALEESIRKVEGEAAKRARPDAEANEPQNGSREQSLRDQGLRDFRDTVAEAQGLGGAAAEANRSAHTAYDHTSYNAGPGDFVPQPADSDRATPAYDVERSAAEPPAALELHELRQALRGGAHDQPPAGAWPPPPSASHRDDRGDDDDAAYARPARNYGRIVKFILLLLVIAGIAGAGYWQRNAITSMVANLRSTQPAPKPQDAAPPAGRPKIADRIGGAGDAGSKSANAPAAAVAQKVVLYDEDASDPKGKRYVGSALWRTETVSPGPGLAPELAIRTDVEIPERRLRMTWSLRRNTDKALPASHTIEVMFTLPADFAEGGIGNVPGVLMKQTEDARGVPLAGLAVKVTNGYFLIGLSAVDTDVQRNIKLLKERDWFDIPIVYTTGKRAILAIEKGTPGSRAFEEAFRAWGE
ncbi:MAG: hypothetical protein HY543_09885 [Deltaproteobacteria bacterium]|nr:hypothetical protein [Deltaproteobacteria bacterium]